MDKSRSDVTENQRVVILTGLVTSDVRVVTVRGVELVLSDIGDPGCEAEKEPLNGDDINGVDSVDTIDISSGQAAPRRNYRNIKEVPLHGDHIHGVDAGGPWGQGGVRWRHGIAPASCQR